MNTFFIVLLFFSFLFFISIIATRLSAKLGMPLLLVFLAVGMLAGEEGIGGINFDNFYAANVIGQVALAIILLDGGLRTHMNSIRIALKPASVLATWGVFATVIVLGLFTTFFMGVDWKLGFLLAATVGSTDAAAVFALLRNSGVRLSNRLLSTLEVESGANDPMAIFLVAAFVAMITQPEQSGVIPFLTMLLQQLGFGAVIGIVSGYALSYILRKVELAEGLYALMIASGGLMAFAIANLIGGSGFLALYFAGILIGKTRGPATEHLFNVMDGLAWLAQATMFLVLGLLVTPSQLFTSGWEALVIAAFLILIARPLAVYSSIVWFPFRKREIAYISWVGLRGAVPITLAIMPLMANIEHSRLFFDVVFAVVIFSLLIQGTTIGTMARLLKVEMPPHPEPLSSKEIWLTDKLNLVLQSFKVAPFSTAENSHPYVLTRPKAFTNGRLFALIREGKNVRVGINTRMQAGDVAWFVFPDDKGEEFAEQFEGHQDNKSEQEFFGDIEVKPYMRLGELAKEHHFEVKEEDKDRTLGELFRNQYGDVPVAGDSLKLDDAEIIIKELDERGYIKWLGLKVPEKAAPKEVEKEKTEEGEENKNA